MGYDIISSSKIGKSEFQLYRNILGGRLGATLTDRREVILDSVNDLELEAADAHKIRAIIRDILGAHEIGGGNYFGHFSQYCNLHEGFPANLLIQQDLYIHAYLAQPLGRSNLGFSNKTKLASLIMTVIEQEWLSEMLALVSERRRIRENGCNQGYHFEKAGALPDNVQDKIRNAYTV